MNKNTLNYLFALFFVLFGAQLGAQTARISGVVSDNEGQPLPLATVQIQGTELVVQSDLDGMYVFENLEAGDYTLVFAGLGYKSQSIAISLQAGEERVLDVQLLPSVQEEVVVVGYGTSLKRDMTGSVSTVKAEDLDDSPVSNFDQALQGKAPGIQIISANGVAGGGNTKIQIRGTNSIAAGAAPLIVVDGVPISNQDISADVMGAGTNGLSDLNIDDIESIDILKDASAAAIYGARGANGVILVTTKKGKEGAAKFDFSYKVGFVNETNRLRLLSAEEHLALRDRVSIENTGNPEAETAVIGVFGGQTLTRADANAYAAAGGSDWIKETLRTGFFQEANLSASAGNKVNRLYFSGAYRDESSFLKGNRFVRGSGRLNLETDAHRLLTLGANMGLTYSVNDRVATGDGGGLGWAQQIPRYIPIYNDDGTYYNPAGNPLWYLDNRKFRAKRLRSLSNVYAEIKFMDKLRFRSSFGLDYTHLVEDEHQAANPAANSDAWSWQRTSRILNWTVSNYFTYSDVFKEIHSLNAVVGTDAQRTAIDGFGIYGTGFSNPNFTNPQQGASQSIYSYQTGNAIVSFYGRFSYKLMNRYLLSFTARADGSSRFAPGNRYGFFPSVAAGWIISDEKFMQNVKVLNYLKLRLSYGLTGNDNIGDFTRFGVYSPGLGYAGGQALYPSTLENTTLRWEKSQMVDVTVEYGLWENRVSGSLTYFFKRSSDLLLPIQLPTSSGFSTMTVNAGVVNNWGIEFMVQSNNITTKHFKWKTDFNFSVIRNKVVDVAGLPPDAFESGQPGEGRVMLGYAVGQSFLVRFAGVMQEDGQITRYNPDGSVLLDAGGNPVTVSVRAGEALYYDINGNLMAWGVDNRGTPNNSADDVNRFTGSDFYGNRVARGSPIPKFFGGIGNTLTYRGVELSFFFNIVLGHTVYDDPAKNQIGMIYQVAQRPEINDAFSASNASQTVPSLVSNTVPVNSDRFLYDASFARLRSLSLAYTFPKKICQKLKLESLKVYATGFNLLTITRYPGWDPEVLRHVPQNSQQENISFSGPSWQTPQARIVMFGIKLGI